MKIFISVLLMLSVLLCGFALNYYTLLSICEALQEKIESVKYDIMNNRENVENSVQTMMNEWYSHEKYMQIFSNHKNLDEIYNSIIKIKKRTVSDNPETALEEIDIALNMLKDIPKDETLEITNIF